MVDSAREEVMVILEQKFGIRRENVTPQSRLREDMDLDSIDFFDIMGTLESKLGMSIDATEFLRAETLEDFLSILQEIVARR